jgi:hypothetical protein
LINALTLFENENIPTSFLGFKFKSGFPDYPNFKKINFRLINRNKIICRDYKLNDEVSLGFINMLDKIFSRLNFKYYFIFKTNFLNIKTNYLKLCEILHLLLLLYRNKSSLYNNILICIDSNTLISSFIFNKLFNSNIKQVFWSLEVTSYNDLDLFDRILNKLELHALRTTKIIISQSVERLELVPNIKNLDTSNLKKFFIPHSRLKNNNLDRNYFFNHLFNLKKNNTILLHLGWIHDVMDSYNVAKSTAHWEKNLKLVFHERSQRSTTDPYIQKITNISSSSIHLSLNPVPYEELGELISSCDIGIVVYKTQEYGCSWENISKASGKLADYLSFGKPVICSNIPDLKTLISKYNCGLIFNELDELPSLVNKINDSYSMYSQNALKCFNEQFEFSKSFLPLIKSLQLIK